MKLVVNDVGDIDGQICVWNPKKPALRATNKIWIYVINIWIYEIKYLMYPINILQVVICKNIGNHLSTSLSNQDMTVDLNTMSWKRWMHKTKINRC